MEEAWLGFTEGNQLRRDLLEFSQSLGDGVALRGVSISVDWGLNSSLDDSGRPVSRWISYVPAWSSFCSINLGQPGSIPPKTKSARHCCTHGDGSQHARRLPEHSKSSRVTHLDEWGGSVRGRSKGDDSIGNCRPWRRWFGVGRNI